jgi:hypothetical protein
MCWGVLEAKAVLAVWEKLKVRENGPTKCQALFFGTILSTVTNEVTSFAMYDNLSFWHTLTSSIRGVKPHGKSPPR